MRRALLALALVLALLAGQFQAARHALAHATAQVEQCDDDSLFSSLGSALGAEPPPAAFAAAADDFSPAPARPDAPLPHRYSFHSRAPPVSPS